MLLRWLQPNEVRDRWDVGGSQEQEQEQELVFCTCLKAGSSGLLNASEWNRGIPARFCSTWRCVVEVLAIALSCCKELSPGE